MASQPVDATTVQVRFHDLDALRAAAMLLGILLHAMLAHVPALAGIWPVADVSTSPFWGTIMAAIHGFRMPLFFLLSGFFTAMLWRKRGLKSLLGHRSKRILLPLCIGVFTIVPAVWFASGFAKSHAAKLAAGGKATLWSLAALGDVAGVDEIVTDETINSQDPLTGATPLAMAAISNQTEVVKLLIAKGADVNALSRDGASASHAPFLFGQAEVAKLLIDAGADLSIRDSVGGTPIDALQADWGTTNFIAGLIGMSVDQEQVEQGRAEIRRHLNDSSIGIASGDSDSEARGEAIIKGLIVGLFYFPFFHHLWFLWFLIWLVLGFCVYVGIANWLIDSAGGEPSKCRRFLSAAVVSPLRYLWLIPLLCVPVGFMGASGEGFGPDTSSGLLPLPHVLLYYAIFFGVGALYYDAKDTSCRLGSRWWLTLPIGLLVVFPLGLEFTTGQWGFRDTWLSAEWHRPASIFLQVAYAWLLTFGCIGAFRRVFSRENSTIRYLSDASYWLYLLHLPLIIFVQAYTAQVQLPAFVKVVGVSLGVSLFLLVIYEYAVRYTFVGAILNGRKTRSG